MAWMRLTGYADKFGVHPGDTIRFHVNCDGPKKYDTQLVKMIHGDTNPRGPGLIERKRRASLNGSYKGRRQVIHSGSYGCVEDSSQLRAQSFTLQWLGLADDAEDPSEVLEARRPGPGHEVAQEQGLRPLRQRGRLRRASHQRQEAHDRRAAPRSRLALPRRELRRQVGPGDPLSRAAGGLRPRSRDQAGEGEDRRAGQA